MDVHRFNLLALSLIHILILATGCSSTGEVESEEGVEKSAEEADSEKSADDGEEWRFVVHPSDPMARHLPQIIAPAGASHEELPCRIESPDGGVITLEYDEEGRRHRIISELPPDMPPELPIYDTVYSYTYDEEGELVRFVVSPLEEDESEEMTDISLETVEHDEYGNPLRQVYGGSATYEVHSFYDEEGRLVRLDTVGAESGEVGNRKEFFYDELGRLARLEDDHNLDGEPNEVMTYVYGDDGRLKEMVRESHIDGAMLEQIGAVQEPKVLTYVHDCEQ